MSASQSQALRGTALVRMSLLSGRQGGSLFTFPGSILFEIDGAVAGVAVLERLYSFNFNLCSILFECVRCVSLLITGPHRLRLSVRAGLLSIR